MYHKVPIQKLSHSQIMKLLKGDRIRVKHGSGHEIHVSEEQHKKIHAAHKKGAGTTIQFDPFQQQMEAHHVLRSIGGKGFKEGALKFLRKEVLPTAIDFGAEQLKKVAVGDGMKKIRVKKKTPAKKGKGFKEGALKFLRKEVLPTAIDFAAEQAKHAAIGDGIHHGYHVHPHHAHAHHAHPHHAHAHHAHAHGGALLPAGYGLMPAGHGLMMKKRGRPAGKGKKGKGVGEDILHGIQEYGPSAAMMLPLLL
jgi:hypothetical protein